MHTRSNHPAPAARSIKRKRFALALLLCPAWLALAGESAPAEPAEPQAPQAAQAQPAQAADAEADDGLSPAHAAALRELGDADYAVRQRATARLLRDDQLETATLAELYAQAETAEQRHRLLDIARHHTIRRMRQRVFDRAGERGAIGVYHREVERGALPGRDRPAIEIIRPMPGFPAYPHLRAGDLVLAVEGEPLAEQDVSGDFQSRIQQLQRGDRIALRIERDGEVRDVQFRLASHQALRSVYADAYDLGMRSPFAEQWQTVRDQLRDAGPAIEPLRIDPGRSDDAGRDTPGD